MKYILNTLLYGCFGLIGIWFLYCLWLLAKIVLIVIGLLGAAIVAIVVSAFAVGVVIDAFIRLLKWGRNKYVQNYRNT